MNENINQLTTMTKLNKKNFKDWREDIDMELKIRGLSKAIEAENVDEMIDVKARRIILETMDSDHRAQVRGYKTAREIIKRLELSYAEATASRKFRLMQKFFRASKQPSEDIDTFIGKMDGMKADLESMDITIDEDVFLATIIGALPAEFGNVTESWELAAPTQRTKQNLIVKLLNKEADLSKAVSTESTFLIKKGRPDRMPESSRLSIEEQKKVTRCGHCKQIGHWHKECPNKATVGSDKPKVFRANMNIGDLPHELRDKWLADSGATSHMCNNAKSFAKLEILQASEVVSLGDGSTIEVVGRGTINYRSVIGGVTIEGTLSDVQLIPSLATNLLSVGSAAKMGASIIFDDNTCQFVQKGQPILQGNKLDGIGLYLMEMEIVEQQQKAFIGVKNSIDHLHELLGHASKNRIAKLLKDSSIKIKAANEQRCAECPVGKGQHASHPTSRKERAVEVGARVHLDLVHSGTQTERSYYLLSKDEASEFCFVHFMGQKTDVCEIIARMIREFEIGSGYRVRSIITDGGSEFCNNKVDTLFLYERIVHSKSSPHTPQQNGLVERAVQTINNMARVMISASNLPSKLVNEAIRTACYINNRLPTNRSDLTPYERFYGKKPDMSNLIKFGQPGHFIINGIHLKKFDPRSIPCFIVGYTERVNTYRIYLPENQRVIETADLIIAPHQLINSPEEDITPGDYVQIPSVSESSNDSSIMQRSDYTNQEHGEISLLWDDAIDSQCTTAAEMSTASGQADTAPGSNTTPTAVTPVLTQSQLQILKRLTPDTLRRLIRGAAEKNINECSLSESTPDEIIADFYPRRRDSPTTPTIENTRIIRYPALGHRTDTQTENQTQTGDQIAVRSSARLAEKANKNQANLVLLAQSEDHSVAEPTSYEEAISSPDSKQWKIAMDEEFNAHKVNGTWKIVRRPQGYKVLSTKWVFKMKRGSDGNIERFKARLVVRGFEQREGLDFKETYAPVATIESIKCLFALALQRNMVWLQFDVATAFLHGAIEEEIYIEAPKGLILPSNCCLKLEKALYGLRQAPRAWSSCFTKALTRAGYKSTISDPCIYTNSTKSSFIATYVDDGVVFAGSLEECTKLVSQLKASFNTRVVDGSVFLGLEISRSADQILLRQRRYIDDMMRKFSMIGAKPLTVPALDVKKLFEPDSESAVPHPYRAAIGSLLYLALNTRPDILFITILLSRFNQAPKPKHWEAVQRVLRYISGTRDFALVFENRSNNHLRLDAFSDSDWATAHNDSASTTGIYIALNGCPIICQSRQQKSTALSTCEAEFIAASECVKELEWLRGLMFELGSTPDSVSLHIDNKPTIQSIKAESFHRGLKHIRLRYSYILEQYRRNQFNLIHVQSERQIADLLTKMPPGPTFANLRTRMNVKMATAAVLIVSAIGCSLAARPPFTKSEPVVWRLTEHKVPLGSIIINDSYRFINPCAVIKEEVETSPVNSTDRIIYERMHELCDVAVDRYWKPALARLATAAGSVKPIMRYKREPITATALAIAGLYFITTSAIGIGSGLYFGHPRSPFHTVPTLEKHLDHLGDQVGLLRNMSAVNLNIIEVIKEELHSTAIKTEDVRRQTQRSAVQSVDVAWMSSDILTTIKETAQLVDEISAGYHRHQVPLGAISKLIGLPQLAHYHDEMASWIGIKTIKPNARVEAADVFELYFSVIVHSDDTFIYKADPFILLTNVSSEQHNIRYNGPEFIVHNHSSQCTRGINEPRQVLANEHCPFDNYEDHELQLWVRADIGDVPIQVKKNYLFNSVFCYGHIITIDETKLRCPAWPISIEAARNFTVGNTTHSGLTWRVDQQKPDTLLISLKQLNQSLDEDPTWVAHLERMEALDRQVKLLEEINSRPLFSKLSKEIESSPYMFTIGSIGTLVSIVGLILILCRNQTSGGPVTDTATASPQVNVTANIENTSDPFATELLSKIAEACILDQRQLTPSAPRID